VLIKNVVLVLSLAFLAALPAVAQESTKPEGRLFTSTLTSGDTLGKEYPRVSAVSLAPSTRDLGGRKGFELGEPSLPKDFDDSLASGALLPDAPPDTVSFVLGPTSLAESAEPYIPPILPCACGCGIFEVGNGSMLPQGQGGLLFFEWDYQSQNHNWSRHSKAPAEDNGDKLLWTSFFRFGLQYMFSERWGMQVDAPFAHRYFRRDDGTGTGTNQATEWTDWGDMRIKGLYTGFFKDMSLGVDFGLKLPTGNYTQDGADRDTELGTGSTDLLLGGFYRTPISPDHNLNAFFQVEGDFPLFTRDQYRPGFEVDASVGINYQGFSLGNVTIAPFGQVLLSGKTSDRGANSAQPVASGYQRVLLSPGIELMMHPFMIYADVEFPVWQNMRGDQLVAPALFKVVVAFSF